MKTIAFLMALFLVGCTIGPPVGPTGKIPPINEGDETGEIIVIRDNSILGFANSFYIAVDGTDVFSIKKGQCTKFKLLSGNHYFGMKHLIEVVGENEWDEDYKRIDVLAGSKTYIVVSPNMSSIDIQIVDKKEGIEWMEDCEYISMEQ